MTLSSRGIFVLHHADHPMTDLYRQAAARLLA
jgi:hypothetical protein